LTPLRASADASGNELADPGEEVAHEVLDHVNRTTKPITVST
jgi:hypothetical protein